MGRDDETVKPPSAALLATEGRGLLDIAGLFAAAPLLATAPRGEPHPVVVLPGLGADDRSTIAIRGVLKTLGYQVYGWGRGRNVRAPDSDLSAMATQVAKLREDSGLKVSLVGWSRGGIIAREVARQIPDAVRMVITLILGRWNDNVLSRPKAEEPQAQQRVGFRGKTRRNSHPRTGIHQSVDGDLYCWLDFQL